MPLSDSEKPEHSFPPLVARAAKRTSGLPRVITGLSAICAGESRARGPGSRDKSWRSALEGGRLGDEGQGKYSSLLGLLNRAARGGG
jgi:hypothetical protein